MNYRTENNKIIGICLLKNEEYYVAWSIMNVVEFCDHIIVLDNNSTDNTRNILENIAQLYDHIRIIDVDDAYDTHKHVEPYVGTQTWIICVDGDEIYDPVGLLELRKLILDGKLDSYWSVACNCLHALGVDLKKAKAFGYTVVDEPSDIPLWKTLFNLGSMVRWHPGRIERLHGFESIVFKEGYSHTDVLNVREQAEWRDCFFRCLHLCFMPRSSLDQHDYSGDDPSGRENPQQVWKLKSAWRRIRYSVMRFFDHQFELRRNSKHRSYASGPVRSFDIAEFGTPRNFCHVDPNWEVGARVIEEVTENRKHMQR